MLWAKRIWAFNAVVVATLVVALVVERAHAGVGAEGTGMMMNPSPLLTGGPPAVTYNILTEAGDPLITEASDHLVTEAAP